MSVVITLIARLSNWRALHELYAQRLAAEVHEAGAIRLRVFRNTEDAAEVLLAAEAPTAAVGQALRRMLAGRLRGLALAGEPDERIWEAMRWEAGEAPAASRPPKNGA